MAVREREKDHVNAILTYAVDLLPRSPMNQCDQIWRNFAIFAKS